ncbi:MAG: hypothetical protein HQK53_06755 [Oligoflexia bacterium]|nr:hypothetical protein [Oligoflexia bacterium]
MMNNCIKIICLLAKLAGMISGSMERLFFSLINESPEEYPCNNSKNRVSPSKPKSSTTEAAQSRPRPKIFTNEKSSSVPESLIIETPPSQSDSSATKASPSESESSVTKVLPSNSESSTTEVLSADISPSNKNTEELVGTKLSSVPGKYDAFCEDVLPKKRTPIDN